jgi:hypothetical protein
MRAISSALAARSMAATAHRLEAHRRHADERGDVRGRTPWRVERSQVFGELLPAPADAGAEGVDRHALDEQEELHDGLAVLRSDTARS